MAAAKTKSVEQKLFEAFANGRSLRLSADEVERLVGNDDAILTRICNQAAIEAGIEEVGHGGDAYAAGIDMHKKTWNDLKDRLSKETNHSYGRTGCCEVARNQQLLSRRRQHRGVGNLGIRSKRTAKGAK